MLGCVPVHMIWLPVTKIKFKLIWNLRWGSLPSPGSQRLHTAVTNYTSTAGKKPFCFSLAVTFFFPTLHCLPSRSQGIWYTDSSWSYRGTCTQREWVSVSKWKTVEFWFGLLGSGVWLWANQQWGDGAEPPRFHPLQSRCGAGCAQLDPSFWAGLPHTTAPAHLPQYRIGLPATELVTPGQRELLKGKNQYSVVHKNCLGLSASQSSIWDF